MSGKQLAIIIAATFITIVLWVIFDIVHTRSEVKIPDNVSKLLEPVNPNFDQQTLNGL
ncbi:hypothetical protein HY389_00280 [Candidatus Daviesbacteria bacterium]|nr:hypothetical protein [Candidatus Daviesbacteria bacterium]